MVPVPVPVPTFEKVTVPVPVPVPAPYQDHKKQIFLKKVWTFFDFLLSKLFYKEKAHKFQQIYGKLWMKKMFIEGNQIHNFMCSSGSGTVINYGSGSGSDFLTSYGSGSGSGSTSQKVTVPTVPVPVPQHCTSLTKALLYGWRLWTKIFPDLIELSKYLFNKAPVSNR
jgi:hypothetical protein